MLTRALDADNDWDRPPAERNLHKNTLQLFSCSNHLAEDLIKAGEHSFQDVFIHILQSGAACDKDKLEGGTRAGILAEDVQTAEWPSVGAHRLVREVCPTFWCEKFCE